MLHPYRCLGSASILLFLSIRNALSEAMIPAGTSGGPLLEAPLVCAGDPMVQTRNGSLCGMALHISGRSQDVFLGVPFAQPPVGRLRFRHPRSYNMTYEGRDARIQPNSCPGYGGFSSGIGPMSEDCLYLNIVRPGRQSLESRRDDVPSSTSYSNRLNGIDRLPVLVWIYGGGFTAGGIADPRFNMSYIVAQADEISKPIIAVSLNYRVAGFGFLASKEVLTADGKVGGVANAGLYDQRLALRWIRENVATFGGDPDKVTIWGESAGAFSVAYHLTMFGGDSNDLFRAAIMESGTALGSALSSPEQLGDVGGYQEQFDNVTTMVGCSATGDKLQCLREAPYEALFEAFESQIYTPILDGNMLRKLPSESLRANATVQVPLLLGSNTDEGTATFWGPRGVLNTTHDVAMWVKSLNGGDLTASSVERLLRLYPDDPVQGCPFNTGTERFSDQGWQYKRGAAIATDLFVAAGRRSTATHFAKLSNDVYSYRFDQPPWDGEEKLIATVPPVYSTHFTEVSLGTSKPVTLLLTVQQARLYLRQPKTESLQLDRTILI